jgi:hypothetical protein
MNVFKITLLRCGKEKAPRNAVVSVRTPVAGFCLIPENYNFMENEINFAPLAEMLNAEGLSASDMSVFFDELAYDYIRTIIELQQANLSPRTVLHKETHSFIYLLRELRDVFLRCSIKK